MEKCLVKKYKVESNNPDLPVLETMQQFTLDAIAASGNASMTDAQKSALNHFFYQVGAIENSSMWQKIKYLGLPMICNENLAKALTNYVNNLPFAATNWSFSNNGVKGSSPIEVSLRDYVGDSWDWSVVLMTSQNGFSTGGADETVRTNTVSQGTTLRSIGARSVSKDVIDYLGTMFVDANLTPDFHIAGINIAPESAYAVLGYSSDDAFSGHTIEGTTGRNERQYYQSGSPSVISLKPSNSYCASALVASRFTNDELLTVMKAMTKLKKAFITLT